MVSKPLSLTGVSILYPPTKNVSTVSENVIRVRHKEQPFSSRVVKQESSIGIEKFAAAVSKGCRSNHGKASETVTLDPRTPRNMSLGCAAYRGNKSKALENFGLGEESIQARWEGGARIRRT